MSFYRKALKKEFKKHPWLRNETTFDVQFTAKEYNEIKARERLLKGLRYDPLRRKYVKLINPPEHV